MDCKDCIFVHENSWRNGDKIILYHECRKKSPELTLKNTEEAYTAWPSVKLDDWCGEFTEKGIQSANELLVNELGLKFATVRILNKAGIKTVKQLRKFSNEELLKIPQLGETRLISIRQHLRMIVNGNPL